MDSRFLLLQLTVAIQNALPHLRRSTVEMYAGNATRLQKMFTPAEDVFKDNLWMDDPGRVCGLLKTHFESLSTQAAYLKTMVCLCNVLDKSEECRRHYSDELSSAVNQQAEIDRMQRLDKREVGRWPSYEEVEANRDVLCRLWFSNSKKKCLHFKWLLYQLFCAMKDVCVFRLDVVYMTRLVTEVPPEGFQDKTVNYIVVGDTSSVLYMFHFKTSDSHGFKKIELVDEFHILLKESLRLFPRTWFVPSMRDPHKPLSKPHASAFVKDCWVLDDRPDKPTADDLRSSITTRFFSTHQRIVERDVFASASCSSRPNMEMYYYKA